MSAPGASHPVLLGRIKDVMLRPAQHDVRGMSITRLRALLNGQRNARSALARDIGARAEEVVLPRLGMLWQVVAQGDYNARLDSSWTLTWFDAHGTVMGSSSHPTPAAALIEAIESADISRIQQMLNGLLIAPVAPTATASVVHGEPRMR